MAGTPKDKLALQRMVSGWVTGETQYGTEHGLCSALEQYATAPLKGMIAWANPPLVADDTPPPTAPLTQIQPAPHIEALEAPAGDNFKTSQWFYQVCTEVGFFQVHNPDRTASIMVDGVTEDYWVQQCNTRVGQQPDITATRERYYNSIARGEASHILFVNSAEDPWSALSFIDSSTAPAGVNVYVVQGGSHCSDLSNLKQDSLLGVFEAHKLFHDLAVTWLQ